MIIRSLGCYGINNDQADFDECLTDIKNIGFNAFYFFLFDRWTYRFKKGTPYKWDKLAKCYDMSTPNEGFYKRTRKLISTAFAKGLAVGVKFHTQYHLQSWNKYKGMQVKVHPYFDNNFKVNSGDNLKEIYDGITFAPLNNKYWISWEDVNPAQNKFNFSSPSPFGAAIQDYIIRCITILVEEFKKAEAAGLNPTMWYAPNNEEIAGQYGDRSEIFVWIREQFVKAGLTPDVNSNFFSVKNIQFRTNTPNFAALTKELAYGRWIGGVHRTGGVCTPYADGKLPRKLPYGLGSKMEIHIDGANELKLYTDLAGIKLEDLFPSNDGTAKDPANFVSTARDFWDAGGNDFIYDESVFNPDYHAPWDWMYNWRKSIQGHGKIPH